MNLLYRSRLLFLLAGLYACRKPQDVSPQPLSKTEFKNIDATSTEISSFTADASLDAKPMTISTHFTGATQVKSIDGNIVVEMPSGEWLQVTSSGRDDAAVLSSDRTRILFERRLPKDACPLPPEGIEDGCHPCWELWMIASGSTEVWLVGDEEARLKKTDRDGPWTGIIPVGFSQDGETVYFNDMGSCTLGSAAGWAYNLRTKRTVQLAIHGFVTREVRSGPYKGYVVVSRSPYREDPMIGGHYDVEELVSKSGKKLLNLPLDATKQKTFLKE